MSRIVVELNIGPNLDPTAMLDALERRLDELSHVLLCYAGSHDLRATVDTSPRLTDIVKLNDGLFELTYEYEWSAYYGCQNMDRSDTAEESITFTYEGGMARFERDQWIEPTGE